MNLYSTSYENNTIRLSSNNNLFLEFDILDKKLFLKALSNDFSEKLVLYKDVKYVSISSYLVNKDTIIFNNILTIKITKSLKKIIKLLCKNDC